MPEFNINREDKFAVLVFLPVLIAIAFLYLVYSPGCDDPDGCEFNEIRCNGSVLEICDRRENWNAWGDCEDIVNVDGSDEPWVCCEQELLCLPESECNE